MNVIRMLLQTLAIRSAVSQSPKTLQVPGMNIMVGRETPCGLGELSLNVSGSDGFVLPKNMTNAFANEEFEWAEYQVSAFL